MYSDVLSVDEARLVHHTRLLVGGVDPETGIHYKALDFDDMMEFLPTIAKELQAPSVVQSASPPVKQLVSLLQSLVKMRNTANSASFKQAMDVFGMLREVVDSIK